ncbi:uncharacterized protein LOC113217004 isoform X2 [Frankliniella occidentalis]|uniref:Uncharacterized protein LOC113217004 isoform X2 n=1 Tax=Frankliniella occidentalis TaxID=133901 RepID=A0A9C6XC44_FRAOC|nr:uncharacterized protein LOC113217004 isoform X2 [Frankliniella occidentalis]
MNFHRKHAVNMEDNRKRKSVVANTGEEPPARRPRHELNVPLQANGHAQVACSPQSPFVQVSISDTLLDGTPKASKKKLILCKNYQQADGLKQQSPSVKTPRMDKNFNVTKKSSKTPSSARRTPKMRLQWCRGCDRQASAGCRRAQHDCLALQEARSRAAQDLLAAQDRLRRLEQLEVRAATTRLRCTAQVMGVGERDIELALSSLGGADLRALCLYLEGLELEPEEAHLSASSAGCEAIATRCAKLPDRLEGVTIMPGAVLLLGCLDRERGDDDDRQSDDPDRSWFCESPPALRIYYDLPVAPQQAQGSKVLGYITCNLKHIAAARPGGESNREGRAVRLLNVTVISE